MGDRDVSYFHIGGNSMHRVKWVEVRGISPTYGYHCDYYKEAVTFTLRFYESRSTERSFYIAITI